jgi:ankyrin repeat protein
MYLKIMLEHEANVNAQDTKDRTALYHASKQGNIQIFLSLLGHGADVTIPGVLQAAAASNYETTEIISILLEKGADVNSRGGRYGNPLQAACRSGAEISAIQLLLRHGADVNAQGGKYGTALRAASLFAPTSVVELLMEHGADVEPHGTGGSALELASSCGNMDTVRLLLKKSALLSEEPPEDRPAFHIVAALDNTEMCRLFLEHCPSREVVQLLTERGVAEFSDTDLSDASDETDGSVESDAACSDATDVSDSSEEKDGILENEVGGDVSKFRLGRQRYFTVV